MRRVPGLRTALACAFSVLGVTASFAVQPVHAPFVSTAVSSGNGFGAASLALSLDDGATAQFSATNMRPQDDPRSRCVTVTNTGTASISAVVLHVAGLGGTGLGNYVKLSVLRGTNTGSTAPSCSSMTYGGVVYTGTLAGFPTSAGSGVTDGGGALAVGASRAYQIDVSLSDAPAAQGTSASFSLTWTGSRAGWSGAVANPTSTLTASTDVAAPSVTAATAVATASPQVPGHVVQGAAYRFYANSSDSGAPATLVKTATADLAALTSGQGAANLSAGSYSVAGTTYGYGSASLTAGSSLASCRYTAAVTATDWAGNSSTTDQPLMIDRTLTTSTSQVRIDGAQGTSGVGWDQVPAGDVNGDGRTDWLVSAYTTSPAGRSTAGAVYVVFGQAGTATIDLSTLGTRGYAIQGAAANDQAGYDVAALGDVNGDGRADQLVTAPYADNGGRTDSGSAYVVFGKATTTAVDLSALGTQGYRIDGAATGDLLGTAAEGLGDINGDGRADLVVGAQYSDATGRADAGTYYVLYGKAGTTTVDLASSLGTAGYRIDGPLAGSLIGDNTVRAVGDLNADGRADLAVADRRASVSGRSASGSVYVVWGKGTPSDVDLGALGTNGYRIDGASANDKVGSVGAAGDVNGDGRPDLVLGASQATRNGRSAAGLVYVLWGKSSTSTQDLASLGTGGYRFDGAAAGDLVGSSVAGIGDVNGDGVPDLAAGARAASESSGNGSGAAYVLFGSTTGGTTTDLAAYGTKGYRWEANGVGGDMAGASVADAGDVDGDGVRDLLVGAPGTDSNGRIDGGTAYLVLSPTCSYRQGVLQTPGLQSYWRLNETSGSTVADGKGSVSGAYGGTPVKGAGGATSDGDTAMTFTAGSSDRVDFGDVYDFAGFSTFSTESWIKVSSEALDGTFCRIMGKDGWASGTTQGWSLELTPAGGYPQIAGFARRIKLARWHNGSNIGVTGSVRLLPGRWYHVVTTSDATSMKIYVNGVLDASMPVANSIIDASNQFYVGPGSWQATIDDVAIYNTALTATQVLQHYATR